MRDYLTDDEKEKGWLIHDSIKNHDFRKKPEKYLFEKYNDLIYKMHNLFCGYNKKENFHSVERRECIVKWSKYPQMIAIDLWTIPNIALINEMMHDYNGIKWRLSSKLTSGEDAHILMSKYIEMTELMLMVFHKLLEGDIVSEIKYPTDNNTEDSRTYVCFTKNKMFDNLWTKNYFLNKELYTNKE